MNKIRILGTPWHVSHQAELLKLSQFGIEFTYVANYIRSWSDKARPMPADLKWTAEYKSGLYDMSILHLDQQCVNPDIGKGKLYRQLNEAINDIPKVVINHGTPMYPEFGIEEDIVINGGKIFDVRNQDMITVPGIAEQVGKNFMIVNSYEAAQRWGWGHTIIHGMNPDEFMDLPKEPRICVVLSPGGLDKYYNRTLLSYVRGQLLRDHGIPVWQTQVDYIPSDYDDYREFIGRSLINFYPGLDSPMPRGRTEAMLSGSLIVTTKHHGADRYIENGKNGFIVPDNPLVISSALSELLKSQYKECIRIGQEGKKTAQKVFHIDRFLYDWLKVIEYILGDMTNEGKKYIKEYEAGHSEDDRIRNEGSKDPGARRENGFRK